VLRPGTEQDRIWRRKNEIGHEKSAFRKSLSAAGAGPRRAADDGAEGARDVMTMLFVLEVVKAWSDPKQRNPKTIHHRGHGNFVVDGAMIKLKSKMR
jgi:hypothetical protein